MRILGNRTAKRSAATIAVTSVLVLGPGLPASADTASGATAGPSASVLPAASPDDWKPPLVDMGLLPKPSTTPDQAYKPSTGCIQSGVGPVPLEDKPLAQLQLQINQAHAITEGEGQTVAVIDTGVNANQPFLKGRVEPGADYIVNGGNGTDDCDGHGTEVAGIVAADTSSDPRIGFTGVAPKAKIVAYRQTSSNFSPANDSGGQQQNETGAKGAGNLETLAWAIQNAADRGDVKVITMSVDNCRQAGAGISRMEAELQAAIHHALLKDIVVVAAAGNLQGQSPGSGCPGQNNNADPNVPNWIVSPPWFSDDVLSVAATDVDSGNVADFSVAGPWVSVAAPGTKITSLDPRGTLLSNNSNESGQQGPIQGTSFAAPYVAGLAALVRAKFPTLSAREVMHRIEATAQHPGGPDGRNNLVGYGIINPMAALTAVVPGENGVAPAQGRHDDIGLIAAPKKDWAPMQVALIGTGSGVALLLITLFVVRTVRRQRTGVRPLPRRS